MGFFYTSSLFLLLGKHPIHHPPLCFHRAAGERYKNVASASLTAFQVIGGQAQHGHTSIRP